MHHHPVVPVLSACFVACTLALTGCESKAPEPVKAPNANNVPPAPAHDDHDDHHGGPVIDLGTGTIGAFSVKATRDQGQIVAGKDAPVDTTVTPASGGTAKAVAVRFWIGTEDGKGSVKAKADIEDPKEPNRWHTHAEIPNPLPAGSKLWVEIEDDKGAIVTGSFDLKQ
jgi:hypothetical protein